MGEEARKGQEALEDEQERKRLEEEELEKQDGEALPERQAMSTIRLPLDAAPGVLDHANEDWKVDTSGDPV